MKEKAAPPKRLLDLTEIPPDGDEWEAFTRDFLTALGFTIEVPPSRGADGGKDMIVSEALVGRLARYPFRWLVSCKHFAHSGKAVSEKDEPNIVERVRTFRCDGFMGVYSTLPTTAFVERLRGLRDSSDLKDYRVFDARLIENHVVRVGFSHLLLRYCPKSDKRVRPTHAITGNYIPLTCASCGRDMLSAMMVTKYRGVVSWVRKQDGHNPEHIVDMYWACKGDCDRTIERGWHRRKMSVGWEDISDLLIPVWYLRFALTIMNRLRNGDDIYDVVAYDKLKRLLMALGQRVFREVTDEERERFEELVETPFM